MKPTALNPDQYHGFFLWIEGQFNEYYPVWRVINGSYDATSCRTRTEATFSTVDDAISAGRQRIDRAIAKINQRQNRLLEHNSSKTSKAGAAVKNLLFKRQGKK